MTFNKAQADELFEREAVLIGTDNVVPAFRVAALFGPDAERFACRPKSGSSNAYGVGDFSLDYITYRGFLTAATYYNVRQLQKEAVAQEESA